jgi:hypothetical protein
VLGTMITVCAQDWWFVVQSRLLLDRQYNGPCSNSETLPLRDSGSLRASVSAPSPHTIRLQGATRARIPTTTSEMCVDPQPVDPGLSSNGPDGGRKGSRQANIPGALLGTCLEQPACQRGVEDVAFDDVTRTSDGLPDTSTSMGTRTANGP